MRQDKTGKKKYEAGRESKTHNREFRLKIMFPLSYDSEGNLLCCGVKNKTAKAVKEC